MGSRLNIRHFTCPAASIPSVHHFHNLQDQALETRPAAIGQGSYHAAFLQNASAFLLDDRGSTPG